MHTEWFRAGARPGFIPAARSIATWLACGALAFGSVSLRGQDQTSVAQVAPAGARQLVIVAHNYAFQAADTIPAGLTTLVLQNKGTEPHEAVLVRLEAGKTVADLLQAMATPGPDPAWVQAVGGPGAALPGTESNATLVLAPGHYVLVCGVPAANGKPHVAMGMARDLTVSPSSRTAPTPASDVSVAMVDYSFNISGPLSSGSHTFRVTNDSKQGHMMLMVRLAPGKTLADWMAWSAKSGTPEPIEWTGGMGYMSPGGAGYFTVRLKPGAYGMICFIPDPSDHKPHFMHGMEKEFTVS
jgi:hypothetical protein